MIYLLVLIPATALSVAGYFVFYLSHRSEGAFQKFGKYLGFWAFALAALLILGAIFAAVHCSRYCPMNGMYGRMYHSWPGDSRHFGPRDEEPQDTRPGAIPQAPLGAPNPTAPPGPASPSPR